MCKNVWDVQEWGTQVSDVSAVITEQSQGFTGDLGGLGIFKMGPEKDFLLSVAIWRWSLHCSQSLLREFGAWNKKKKSRGGHGIK